MIIGTLALDGRLLHPDPSVTTQPPTAVVYQLFHYSYMTKYFNAVTLVKLYCTTGSSIFIALKRFVHSKVKF